jgi:predicted small lipoprotein YifL
MHRSRAAFLAAILALAACGTDGPSPSPSAGATSAPTSAPSQPAPTEGPSARPAAEVYEEIRAAVASIRGLEPTSAVDPVTIDEAQLIENFTAEFDAAMTAQQLRDSEDLLITLGLLPPGSSLRALTLNLQGGQVVGYYSPDKDELFVVSRSGVIGPLEEATYAHEFTHQLQDQRFKLDELGLDAIDQSDRQLGVLALVEGDASYVQSQWMFANLDSQEMGEILKAALDPKALEALQHAPAYLRDTATFPYQDGLALATQLVASGGFEAINAAYADPPDSTEQVLHPEKYLDREAPISVSLPNLAAELGAGWSEAGQDTLGELLLRTWLREGKVAATATRAAATGWGGDRLAFLRGPGGAMSVGMVTEWDTAADADEFATAATAALGNLSPGARLSHEPGSTRVTIALGANAEAVIAALAN